MAGGHECIPLILKTYNTHIINEKCDANTILLFEFSLKILSRYLSSKAPSMRDAVCVISLLRVPALGEEIFDSRVSRPSCDTSTIDMMSLVRD